MQLEVSSILQRQCYVSSLPNQRNFPINSPHFASGSIKRFASGVAHNYFKISSIIPIFHLHDLHLVSIVYGWQMSLFTSLGLNFMVTPCINNIQHFNFQLTHTTLKNVEFLKYFKISKTAPTCFGLQGNHHQGATIST